MQCEKVISPSTCCCAAELKGLVLLDVEIPRAWERVVQLKFGPRASEDATRHVYAEIQARCEHMPNTLTSIACRGYTPGFAEDCSL